MESLTALRFVRLALKLAAFNLGWLFQIKVIEPSTLNVERRTFEPSLRQRIFGQQAVFPVAVGRIGKIGLK